MSLADTILSIASMGDRKPITVSQWRDTDGKLYIRHLTSAERMHYAYKVGKWADDGSHADFKAYIVSRVLVDESGKRIFSDAQMEELDKHATAVEHIYREWLEFSKTTDIEIEKKD